MSRSQPLPPPPLVARRRRRGLGAVCALICARAPAATLAARCGHRGGGRADARGARAGARRRRAAPRRRRARVRLCAAPCDRVGTRYCCGDTRCARTAGPFGALKKLVRAGGCAGAVWCRRRLGARWHGRFPPRARVYQYVELHCPSHTHTMEAPLLRTAPARALFTRTRASRKRASRMHCRRVDGGGGCRERRARGREGWRRRARGFRPRRDGCRYGVALQPRCCGSSSSCTHAWAPTRHRVCGRRPGRACATTSSAT